MIVECRQQIPTSNLSTIALGLGQSPESHYVSRAVVIGPCSSTWGASGALMRRTYWALYKEYPAYLEAQLQLECWE
jgi:hypothetical protein